MPRKCAPYNTHCHQGYAQYIPLPKRAAANRTTRIPKSATYRHSRNNAHQDYVEKGGHVVGVVEGYKEVALARPSQATSGCHRPQEEADQIEKQELS